MATTSDYDNIMSGMLPSVKNQQQGVYDYLAQLGRRQGVTGAMDKAARGVAPYAQQVGEAVGRTAPQLAQIKEQERQFNEKQAAWLKEFEQAQSNWEKEFGLKEEVTDWNKLMQQYEMFGFTPEMMEALGYDLGPAAGFNRPNPALQRLWGGMGIPSYGSGGAAPGFSTPANPFNRVTGPNQGPGLLKL